MIDVRAAGDHRVGQRQYLASRACAACAAAELHGRVDQRLQPESFRDRCGQQQAGVRNQIRIIE